jgi:hypothetical protein
VLHASYRAALFPAIERGRLSELDAVDLEAGKNIRIFMTIPVFHPHSDVIRSSKIAEDF